MQTVLDEATEQYRRARFFRELDEGYAQLQANPKHGRKNSMSAAFGIPP